MKKQIKNNLPLAQHVVQPIQTDPASIPDSLLKQRDELEILEKAICMLKEKLSPILKKGAVKSEAGLQTMDTGSISDIHTTIKISTQNIFSIRRGLEDIIDDLDL